MSNNMGSINATVAARKVSETIRKGKKVNLGKIVGESGYSSTVALHPDRVTKTKSYQKALAIEQKPLLEGLEKEITEIKNALARKNKDSEEYRVLIGSLDILIKNYQLLSGGATERQVFVLPSEIIQKNVIEKTDEKPLLDNGSTEPSSE